ncbi:DUF6624 domain-containing protein [Streptomyces sp. NBC_00539]|uniref:DUF6624 domain-containing protein n=1 Tax=Streptomyces sp. NBC_00539 TaxID=2975770 RepID=UPI002E80497C|nr:DUF6624 domain-containing protein [Streptomyces sp. NBC_00539]WUC64136.1 hypothetical protein OG861_07720 [Streptomyces sp. NBC_00539]
MGGAVNRPDLAAELRRRTRSDQQARDHLTRTGEPGGLLRIDADNTAWLKAVVAEHGWPGRELVGDQGADDAWLLVQHADRDPGFQHEALELLTGAVEAADAPPRHLAYLTDRVLIARGRPQLYGTQYTGDDTSSLRPQPVHEPERLDERRAAMGLEPAAAYDERIRRAYGPATDKETTA